MINIIKRNFLIILCYKFFKLLIILFFTPIIYIISLFKPIKIGFIFSKHLGTYGAALEILRCERKIIHKDEDSLYIWFKNEKTDNILLFSKLTNKDIILPSIILKPLFNFFYNNPYLKKKFLIPFRYNPKGINKLLTKEISNISLSNKTENNLWQMLDIHNLLGKVPTTISLNNEEKKIGEEYLYLKNISGKKNFVLFSNRSTAYKNEKIDSSRNASILTQLKAINYLIGNNYVAFRMGRKESPKLPNDIDKNIIDYAFDDNKSDILDLFLFSKSKFLICNAGGIDNFAVVFRKPKFVVDFTQFWDLNTTNSYLFPLLIPKIYKNSKTNEILKFSKVFDLGLDKLSLEKLYSLGFDILDNTPEEILEGTKEMLDIINGKNLYSNDKQKKFWRMADEYSPNIGRFKISEFFFNKNKDLFN